eukprot:scaffold26848_cov49-Cyclotella_meneghiniana.AAC.1
MNGKAGFRLEFIVQNGVHKLTFESQTGEKLAITGPPHSTPALRNGVHKLTFESQTGEKLATGPPHSTPAL